MKVMWFYMKNDASSQQFLELFILHDQINVLLQE